MDATFEAQLRHAGTIVLPILRQVVDMLHVEMALRNFGYDGTVDSLSAEEIVDEFRKRRWISIDPSGFQARITEAGEEQLAAWEQEDRLWHSGDPAQVEKCKRLKGGEPATNLLRIAQLIGAAALVAVHDPYFTDESLTTLLKLAGAGVNLSPALRCLTVPKPPGPGRTAFLSLLRDVNQERGARWEVKGYAGPPKPHRRFLILADGSIVTCGLSLNNINKDEVLDRIPAKSPYAEQDLKFFEKHWSASSPI